MSNSNDVGKILMENLELEFPIAYVSNRYLSISNIINENIA